MSSAEASGRTVSEAVARALEQMGVSREDVDVEILQEPKAALLGFGGRDARVRLTPRPGAAETLELLAAEVTRLMGFQAAVEADATAEGLAATLQGRGLAPLIGRDGRTLDALEMLLGLLLQRRLGRKAVVSVDVQGYRTGREKAVREAALRAAERAVREGVPVPLAPMSARDRRCAHIALKDDARVTTMSRGEDVARHVVVAPRAGDGPPAPPTAEHEPLPEE